MISESKSSLSLTVGSSSASRRAGKDVYKGAMASSEALMRPANASPMA